MALITVHCNHAVNIGVSANTGRWVVFTWLKPYFNARVLIFSMCEGSSQPIANQLNMQKIVVTIFLTIKATIFDTHVSNVCVLAFLIIYGVGPDYKGVF